MASHSLTLRPRVVTAQDVRIDPGQVEDTYLGKVSRYIPAEIVAAYIAASSLILGGKDIPQITLLWVVIAVFGVLTPLWLLYATDVPGKPKAVFQAVVGTVAYLVWVFALSGEVLFPGWYNPVYGGLLLILFTLVVPLLEKWLVK